MTTTVDDATLVVTRQFNAPPARVFDAWMNHDEFQSWIGIEGVHCEVPEFDARVGGRYRINLQLSTGEIAPVTGEFRKIDAPRRIVLTWNWNNDPKRRTVITLTFAPREGGTEMTLRQEGVESPEDRNNHGRGWNSTFNKLAAHLNGTLTA
ncbi:MAG TPA: SRPBCC domain-containing protein [Bauldia sp.]|nr:SRPBCC domain-containing protein [Bauldia sp.]